MIRPYAMPRADPAPMFAIESHPVPAKTNALGSYGIRHIDMPATPERIWRAIREAQAV